MPPADASVVIPPAPFQWADGAEYSQSLRVGEFVFVSGQGGFDQSGTVVVGGMAAQTRQVLDNLSVILAQHGLSLASVIRLGVHIADPADYVVFQSVRREYFSPPWPVSTAVCSGLLVEGMRIEIDAVASVTAARHGTAGTEDPTAAGGA
ncbi:RidA family protein [Amycolatopsis methanolica]|uniref:RidA family protein n=1 Tax=Amycolatopsis methanolica TaxID=1814 RepID=UPI00343C2758